MKDKRFWFGMSVTVIWLVFSAYMLSTNSQPTKLNEWGDFFAGFFAPLAFLWLVIGYLQQGEELKHSTEALRLQADELRNSVEQQSQLVAVSREQMKQELEALQEEREIRRDAARPKFVPQPGGSVTSSGVTTHRLRVANVGNTATNCSFTFDPPVEAHTGLNHALIRRDEALNLEFRIDPDTITKANIKYVDADGLPGEAHFLLEARSPGGLKVGSVVRTL